MKNETQLNRYKKLLQFIDNNLKEDINISKIEDICNYSYRNINRIFQALHQETIGKYIKRIRLEKAAQYLKYSEEGITEIAYNLGFSNVAIFSKAFKNKFNCSPSDFRKKNDFFEYQDSLATLPNSKEIKISFEIEKLPDFQILAIEHKGSYKNIASIDKTWEQLFNYAFKNNLIDHESIFFAEILDDNEITEHINCRYTAAVIIEDTSNFSPKGLFIRRTIKSRKYAKFLHKGPHEDCANTYQKIYSNWMSSIKLEIADAPVLEFYLNDENDTPPSELLTEIYIPIL